MPRIPRNRDASSIGTARNAKAAGCFERIEKARGTCIGILSSLLGTSRGAELQDAVRELRLLYVLLGFLLISADPDFY